MEAANAIRDFAPETNGEVACRGFLSRERLHGIRAEHRAALPWRTLTGHQHFHLDHEGYRAVGESLATFKPKIPAEVTRYLVRSSPTAASVMLNCITPHGKWHMHTTYYAASSPCG